MKILINKQLILESGGEFTIGKSVTISHKKSKDTKILDDIKLKMDNEKDQNKKEQLALKYQKAVSAYNKSKW